MHGNGPGVGNESSAIIHRAFGESDLGAQPAAIRTLGHKHLLAGVETDAALRGRNGAVVFNIVSNKESRALASHVDLAIVDNTVGWRRRIKLPGTAADQVRRGGGSGSHQQAMRVQQGLAADENACLVLQHDVAVGVEGAEELGGIGIVDLVPHDRGGGRLNESGGLPHTDIKTLPIDEGAVGGLNGKLRALAVKGGAALANGGTSRTGTKEGRGQAARCQHEEGRSCPKIATNQNRNHRQAHSLRKVSSRTTDQQALACYVWVTQIKTAR